MKIRFTERADLDFETLRPEIRKAFKKQLGVLLNNPNHAYASVEKVRCDKRRLAGPGHSRLALLLCQTRRRIRNSFDHSPSQIAGADGSALVPWASRSPAASRVWWRRSSTFLFEDLEKPQR